MRELLRAAKAPTWPDRPTRHAGSQGLHRYHRGLRTKYCEDGKQINNEDIRRKSLKFGQEFELVDKVSRAGFRARY